MAGTSPDAIHIRIMEIPELIRTLLTVPLPENYRTARALHFQAAHFSRPFLDREEFQRLNGFKALKKQVEWLCGRYCAKTLARRILMPEPHRKQGPDPVLNTGLNQGLSRNWGKDLVRIQIGYMDQGAPFLVRFPDHCLSLSHSGAYTAAALAGAPGTMMGIDIEAVGRRPDAAFMRTAFTEREIRAMGDGAYEFFRCWTLKEAYLKYIRKGFNESLHRVEIIGGRIFHNGREQDLVCRSLDLDNGYIMGIVSEPGTGIALTGPAAR